MSGAFLRRRDRPLRVDDYSAAVNTCARGGDLLRVVHQMRVAGGGADLGVTEQPDTQGLASINV